MCCIWIVFVLYCVCIVFPFNLCSIWIVFVLYMYHSDRSRTQMTGLCTSSGLKAFNILHNPPPPSNYLFSLHTLNPTQHDIRESSEESKLEKFQKKREALFYIAQPRRTRNQCQQYIFQKMPSNSKM